MKKLFTLFAATAFVLSMVACGGNASNNSATEETTETPAPAAQENDVMAKYESLVNQAIELQGKVSNGDASAIQEYMKIAEEMGKIAEELSAEMANMTPEQAQRFAELGQKMAAAAQQ